MFTPREKSRLKRKLGFEWLAGLSLDGSRPDGRVLRLQARLGSRREVSGPITNDPSPRRIRSAPPPSAEQPMSKIFEALKRLARESGSAFFGLCRRGAGGV